MEIGVDLVHIKRFENIKENKALLNKIFTQNEIDYIVKRNYNLHTIAGMFASKEAFIKALKIGLEYDLKQIEINHEENGNPYIKILNDKNNYKTSLSISHDGDYCISFVIIY